MYNEEYSIFPWQDEAQRAKIVKKQLRRDTEYLATAKDKRNQYAQIGYRRSNNYIPLLLIIIKKQHCFSDILERICLE